MPYVKKAVCIPTYAACKSKTLEDEGRNSCIKNMLFHDENLRVMKYLKMAGFSGKIDLIYIDPPFFSGNSFSSKDRSGIHAYEDLWKHNIHSYLAYLERRIKLMRDLLSDSGSIFVHLDWHASHYVKVMMDRIFGTANFRNEIVWHYYMGGKSKREFARKHDTILFYSKSKKWKFNPQKITRRIDFLPRLPLRSSTGNPVENTYFQDKFGWYSVVTADDVWDVHGVFNLSSEYTGYPTQKPLEILRRIIAASTSAGDTVADFFMGSGTSLLAAMLMGRHFVGCDNSSYAVNTTIKRLMHSNQFNKNDHMEVYANMESIFYLWEREDKSGKKLVSLLNKTLSSEGHIFNPENISAFNSGSHLRKKLSCGHMVFRDGFGHTHVFWDRLFVTGKENCTSITFRSVNNKYTLNVGSSEDMNLFFYGASDTHLNHPDRYLQILKIESILETISFSEGKLWVSTVRFIDHETDDVVKPDLLFVGFSGTDLLPVITGSYQFSGNRAFSVALPGVWNKAEWLFHRYTVKSLRIDIYIRNPMIITKIS